MGLGYDGHTQRNLFEILLNQTEFSLYLPFSDWFGTNNPISVWCDKIWKIFPCVGEYGPKMIGNVTSKVHIRHFYASSSPAPEHSMAWMPHFLYRKAIPRVFLFDRFFIILKLIIKLLFYIIINTLPTMRKLLLLLLITFNKKHTSHIIYFSYSTSSPDPEHSMGYKGHTSRIEML